MIVTKAELHRLVDELPEDAIESAAVLIRSVVRGEIDPAQGWVWTREWQEQLEQSLADLASGRTRRYANSADFLESLT